jgi:hypothetical protein
VPFAVPSPLAHNHQPVIFSEDPLWHQQIQCESIFCGRFKTKPPTIHHHRFCIPGTGFNTFTSRVPSWVPLEFTFQYSRKTRSMGDVFWLSSFGCTFTSILTNSPLLRHYSFSRHSGHSSKKASASFSQSKSKSKPVSYFSNGFDRSSCSFCSIARPVQESLPMIPISIHSCYIARPTPPVKKTVYHDHHHHHHHHQLTKLGLA